MRIHCTITRLHIAMRVALVWLYVVDVCCTFYDAFAPTLAIPHRPTACIAFAEFAP